MRVIIFIAGAAIGAPLRYLIDSFWRKRASFPIGILIVNVIGSFILGITQMNYFVMGFCGAFTTWSAFALDIHSQNRKSALTNIALTFTLSVAAVYAGIWLAR